MSMQDVDTRQFISIIGGTIKIKCDESNPKAVRRDYKLKDGTEGTKFEIEKKNITGVIKDIEFKEGKFGEQILITIDDNIESVVLAIGIGNNKYATDFLKKLPNIELSKEVTLTPYDFEDEKKNRKQGITIMQDNDKLNNFFYDAEKKTAINGFPVPPKEYKDMKPTDWQIYFLQSDSFLREYAEKNILTKFDFNIEEAVKPADDIDPDKLGFAA